MKYGIGRVIHQIVNGESDAAIATDQKNRMKGATGRSCDEKSARPRLVFQYRSHDSLARGDITHRSSRMKYLKSYQNASIPSSVLSRGCAPLLLIRRRTEKAQLRPGPYRYAEIFCLLQRDR